MVTAVLYKPAPDFFASLECLWRKSSQEVMNSPNFCRVWGFILCCLPTPSLHLCVRFSSSDLMCVLAFSFFFSPSLSTGTSSLWILGHLVTLYTQIPKGLKKIEKCSLSKVSVWKTLLPEFYFLEQKSEIETFCLVSIFL